VMRINDWKGLGRWHKKNSKRVRGYISEKPFLVYPKLCPCWMQSGRQYGK